MLPIKKQYVVCDRGYDRSRMQIFSEDGKYCRKINIQYINIVAGIAITATENIVVVDSVTPTLFIMGNNEFLRSIDCSEFIDEPSDLAVIGKVFAGFEQKSEFFFGVSGKEVYICDFKGHSIVVVDIEGNFLRKFGTKQTTTFPNGIDVSDAGDILVGDSHGNFFHVSVYSKQGDFLAEFRCPFIKVFLGIFFFIFDLFGSCFRYHVVAALRLLLKVIWSLLIKITIMFSCWILCMFPHVVSLFYLLYLIIINVLIYIFCLHIDTRLKFLLNQLSFFFFDLG